MIQLSRRGFLTGAVAAVATVAALPVLAAPAAPIPAVVAPPVVPIKPFPYEGPFYYLYPAQWDMFEREGFNMDLCRRVEMIPMPKSKKSIYKKVRRHA